MATLTTDGMNFSPEIAVELESLLSDTGLIDAAHHALAEADNERFV